MLELGPGRVVGGGRPLARMLAQVGASGFARAMRSTGLADELGDGPFTVFAPLGELPDELHDAPGLERILGFHVLPGVALRSHALGSSVISSIGQRLELRRAPAGLRVDGAQLVMPDLEVGQGVVHVIEHMLFPAEFDLLELLHISDNFHRLVAVCEVLGLEELLRGARPWTLLAPRGLTTLPTWKWHAWLNPRGRVFLRRLLERHLVETRCYLEDHGELKNLAGEGLVVRREGEDFFVDGRRVLIANIDARNGLIHVLEGLE